MTAPRSRPRRWHRRHEAATRGQAMVEFILVFPIFLLVLVAFIEFAFAFSTLNALSFTARDVARVGVEGGDRAGTDCSMLLNLERSLGASSDRSGVELVEVFWSDDRGRIQHGAVTSYERTGTWTCTTVDGSTVDLPYTLTSGGYPESERCNVLAGCDTMSPAHPTVDTLGVRLTYDYRWKTPISFMLQMAPSLTFRADQQMRIEPVL